MTDLPVTISDVARDYLAAGLSVLPARKAEKRPTLGSWKIYRERLPSPQEVGAWFANNPDALCVVCGAVSGNLEMLDFDQGGELFSPWCERVSTADPGLLSGLVIEGSPSGGWHVAYRCDVPVSGNLKLAQRQIDGKIVTLIETRGEGGLFLCAPTPGYELLQGELTSLPVLSEQQRDTLLRCAWELNEYQLPVVDGPRARQADPTTDGSPPDGLHGIDRPGDEFNRRGDLRALLERHGWTCVREGQNQYWKRPGKKSGWSATLKDGVFYVFSANAEPFGENQAYSPFAVYSLLEHGGDYEQAARALRQEGYGGEQAAELQRDVDISGIIGALPNHDASDEADRPPAVADPGPIPEHLFAVPGLVARVMDFTLANAPYPNVGLAFCGAMALQSYLAGRKVCDGGDLRPNIYLLALASSGTGKDYPRKVNAQVLFRIGHLAALGDKFASGQGIQDALQRSAAMLFQTDEMDGVLRQINLDREGKAESIPNILLTLYTSADDVYPIRVKAGQKEAGHIDQPHLTLFGTATPQYFYESLSRRMLTNGFFARLIVVDIGKRGEGRDPGSPRQLPEPILEIARWWAGLRPGKQGNLLEFHPEPRVVPRKREAQEAVDALQRQTEGEYDRADQRNDEVARVAWSRTCENAKKLALLYACSENHQDPLIGLPAVEWATAFAMHQTRRQLFLAASYVAENPFHAECLRLMRKLREGGGQMARRELMRTMRVKAGDFDQIVSTLAQQGDIVAVDIPTKTRPAQGYQLA